MTNYNAKCDQNIAGETSHPGGKRQQLCKKYTQGVGTLNQSVIKCFSFHLLLYSSLNPAADTLISEKKWR